MPFSEATKLEVKRKTAFRCCRCQSIGVEVHHIVPESENGSDEIENAAPLCAKCHADFGDNPLKRKEITQMRDWWYEQAVAYNTSHQDLAPLEEKIDQIVLSIQQNSENFNELKATLKEYINLQIDKITPESSVAISSTIVNTPFTMDKLFNSHDISEIGEGANTITYARPIKPSPSSDEGEGT